MTIAMIWCSRLQDDIRTVLLQWVGLSLKRRARGLAVGGGRKGRCPDHGIRDSCDGAYSRRDCRTSSWINARAGPLGAANGKEGRGSVPRIRQIAANRQAS